MAFATKLLGIFLQGGPNGTVGVSIMSLIYVEVLGVGYFSGCADL